MLSEGSDVYSFGVLLMELITGRCPVDYSKPPGEVRTSFLVHFSDKSINCLIILTILKLKLSDELG